jgi:hypothetical protein
MIRSLIALAVAVAPHVVHAQSHPLVGDWSVSMAGGMKIENGEQTIMMNKGVMNVKVVGDSIIATLTMEPMEGRPVRPPSRLAAKVTMGKITFTAQREASVNIGGEMQKVVATNTYVFDPSGDTLAGSLSSEIPGVGGMGAQPITGTRVKH